MDECGHADTRGRLRSWRRRVKRLGLLLRGLAHSSPSLTQSLGTRRAFVSVAFDLFIVARALSSPTEKRIRATVRLHSTAHESPAGLMYRSIHVADHEKATKYRKKLRAPEKGS